MVGKERPDLAENNRQRRVYTEEKVKDIFDRYTTYRGGLRGFAKSYGYNRRYLVDLFRQFIPPEQLNPVMELKKTGNTRYATGRRFEWRVRDWYKEQGYFVLRSPRSASPVDLVAIKKGEVLFIQCKTHGYMSKTEKKILIELAKSVDATPLLLWRGKAPHYPLQREVLQ